MKLSLKKGNQSKKIVVSLQPSFKSLTVYYLACNYFLGHYWLYHRGLIENFEEERQSPASKGWLIVKYIHNDSSTFINKVNLSIKK
jgi:hypothetical protein